VDFSADGGQSWRPAQLGRDEGKYSFRRWETQFSPVDKGEYKLMVRCTNDDAVMQPDTANWNPSGYMRNVIESVRVIAA
jgi:Mo-co oxidoreductase dimerisation domain